MRKKVYVAIVATVVAIACGIGYYFASASTDLACVVPANSVAVAKVDFGRLMSDGTAIAKLLDMEKPEECGLDFKSPAYMFESGDGVFGIVIGVKDDGDTEQWLGKLASIGKCTPIAEKKGVRFTSFGNTLLAGFNSRAMVIVGPVVASGETEYQLKIAKYLRADEGKSVKSTKLYDKLSANGEGMISLVTQTSALPEKVVAPFTLGTPSNSSLSDIYMSATINVVDGKYLLVEGESFAFEPEIDKALKEASKSYNSVKGTYLQTVSADDAFAISCNISGKEYMKLLRSNPLFRTILIGLNTTIDINKMLDGVEGDILIKGNIDAKGNIPPTLLADAVNGDWLDDVGYWKRSCPAGTVISDGKKPKSFSFISKDYHIDFGLTNGDKTLYFVPSSSGSRQDVLAPAAKALPSEIIGQMRANKLCALVNINSILSAYGGGMAMEMAKPLLGGITTIVISVK